MSEPKKWVGYADLLEAKRKREEQAVKEQDVVPNEHQTEPIVPTPTIPNHPHPPPTTPISPTRDFNKRANSLERDALPAGLFPGSSKKLYDALYLRTRGSVQPKTFIQATKRDLMTWSGIRNVKTIEVHIRHLITVGLLIRAGDNGDREGYKYEVRLPEEIPYPPQPSPTIPNQGGGGWGCTIPDQETGMERDQKTGMVGVGQIIDSKDTSSFPKTSLKTNTDDEAFIDLMKILKQTAKEIAGTTPTSQERERWAEVGRVIADELKQAAARAESVSSVPAFLAEHLRRRLSRPERQLRESNRPKKTTSSPEATTAPPPADRRLTPEEIIEQATIIREVIEGGYTMEQAEAQFKGSFHPDDWRAVMDEVQQSNKR